MGGFWGDHKSFFIFACFIVSLGFGSAKAIAEGPVETSSPEETKQKSLPGLRAIPKDVWPTLAPMEELESGNQIQGSSSGLQASWAPGISPYQIHPISAIIAAGVVVAAQSLKEQGRIDSKALWRLFNSTELYAGYVGAVAASTGKDVAVLGGKKLISKLAPAAFTELGKNQTVMLFGNIINAFSYTLAVSSGFEYFSQFWNLAIRDIPNVSSVTDLVGASRSDLVRVGSNLMQYAVMPDMQKRIISSIKYHRIYTFEFIAMNVGLFVGVVVGDQIAKRIGPKAAEGVKKTWSQKLTREMGRLLGGVLGGLAVQFIPDGFKLRINTQLMDWKLSSVRADLTKLMANIEAGIRYKYYPPYHSAGAGSFFFSQVNLHSDMRRLIRTRDLLYSLYASRYFLVGADEQFLDQIHEEQVQIDRQILSWVQRQGGAGQGASIDSFEEGNLSLEDLEKRIFDDLHKDEYQKHYSRVLYAGYEDLNESFADFEDFIVSLHEFQAEEADEIRRELRPISEQ